MLMKKQEEQGVLEKVAGALAEGDGDTINTARNELLLGSSMTFLHKLINTLFLFTRIILQSLLAPSTNNLSHVVFFMFARMSPQRLLHSGI